MAAPEIAPGARIIVRDAEWVVRRVDPTPTGRAAITVIGISQLVRDKEAVFLQDLEGEMTLLDPAQTKLVPDSSSFYRNAILYMESQLRRMTPTGDSIYIGHKAAMDPVPYQLDPALEALRQPRQRLLIASDAASEGISLHYLSHRMIHFDIPWSLMVFQQRNGRIDRYSQTEEPHIVYLQQATD